MKFTELPISWVDFVTLIVLLIGFARGRKRGLSEELLDTLQWVAIVVVGALCYRQLAALLAQKPLLSPAANNIFSYIAIALVLKIIFTLIKKRIGQKLIDGDVFGRFEFYAGMAAGMLRWSCMYFVLLSLLHAPQYTPEELAHRRKEVEYNYGSDFFPSIDKMQVTVFQNSLTGKNAAKYLGMWMIDPSTSSAAPLRNDNSMARRRERDIDAIMSPK
jgi:hypothetical protein